MEIFWLCFRRFFLRHPFLTKKKIEKKRNDFFIWIYCISLAKHNNIRIHKLLYWADLSTRSLRMPFRKFQTRLISKKSAIIQFISKIPAAIKEFRIHEAGVWFTILGSKVLLQPPSSSFHERKLYEGKWKDLNSIFLAVLFIENIPKDSIKKQFRLRTSKIRLDFPQLSLGFWFR